MVKKYSSEFKMEAVKRVQSSGASVARVAIDLGVNENTLHGWIRKYREEAVDPFPSSEGLSAEDERIRQLEKDNRELREENEILKKSDGLLRQESKIQQFEFIRAYRSMYRVAKRWIGENDKRVGNICMEKCLFSHRAPTWHAHSL